jgi:hypothetical protein
MRTHTSARPHAATTRRTREHLSDDAPARRSSQRLIADAVIARYIHDISRDSRHDARAIRARESRVRIAG